MLAIALALSIGAGAFFYNRWDAADARADKAEAALEVEKANEKVVTQFVDRKVEIIKRVPVIRERIVDRLCPPAGVPGAGNPDAAASAEARHGIADEIAACLTESEQLRALQAVLQPQLR